MSLPLQGAVNQGKAGTESWRARLLDEYGFGAEFTPMGELRAVSPFRLVGSTFTGTTVDPNFWTAVTGTGGTASQANAQVTLSTGTTANNGVSLQSVRVARYVSGTSNRFRAAVQLPDAGKANNVRRWGVFSATDGAFFELSGTTFRLVTRKGSVDTAVTTFNGTLGTSFSPGTSVVTYEIYYTNSKVYFVVGDEILHTVSASVSTWTDSMNLPVRLENQNSGGSTTDVTLYCRVASIARFAPGTTQSTYKYQAGTTAGVICKYGAGNLHGLVISGVVNNSVVTLYDNVAASGTILWSSGTMGAQTTPFGLDMHDVPFAIGLTLVVSGANSNVFIAYE